MPYSAPNTTVFRSGFDLWVPALLLCALIVFVGAALREPLIAFASVVLFLLGLVPQAKMKRAELLVQLQQRFSELQSDTRALGVERREAETAPVDEENRVRRLQDERREAYAFYLSFWNLQILEFGLWRYGMIPSDTYAHWIVRRLLSFSPENTEEYFHTKPLLGWSRVQREFVGTDFRAFMDAAFQIGKEVYKERKVVKANQDDYDALHVRIERLLVHAAGKNLWSTFIVRWFSSKRPSLRSRTAEQWAALSTEKLLRESRRWTKFFVIAAALSIPLALVGGAGARYGFDRFVAPLLRFDRLFGPASRSSALHAVSTAGSVVFEPEPPRSRFAVRFAEEGACVPRGGDARGWRGASPSSWSRAFVAEVSRNLAACNTPEHPLRVEVVGFSSSSEFKGPVDCGGGVTTSAEANLRLANARAANVKALLDRRLTAAQVDVRRWTDVRDMEDERSFSDRLANGNYDPAKGPLNRRAEIRVLDAGACE